MQFSHQNVIFDIIANRDLSSKALSKKARYQITVVPCKAVTLTAGLDIHHLKLKVNVDV